MGFFVYAEPDAQPGDNVLTISLFPNVWIVSAFPTEVEADGTPHVGDAHFNIESVELDTHGEICQVRFNLDFGNPLPYGAMLIIGYIPIPNRKKDVAPISEREVVLGAPRTTSAADQRQEAIQRPGIGADVSAGQPARSAIGGDPIHHDDCLRIVR